MDLGEEILEKSYPECKILVSTSNSTTFLESIALNIPTVVFWNPNHWELRESAKPYHQLLKKTGILHDSPESAASHITNIWDDVSSWWNEKDVRSALNHFREKYCREIENIDRVISNKLKEIN